MLIINDVVSLQQTLALPLDPRLKSLLLLRVEQLGGEQEFSDVAQFMVVQGGDGMKSLEKALGFSPLVNPVDGNVYGDPKFEPGWEWVEDHGHCFEAPFILSDDGFGWILLIEHVPMLNRKLRALCIERSIPAQG